MAHKAVKSLERKKAVEGYFFILPWFIGFVLFFTYPIYLTVKYSLSEINKNTLEVVYIGARNFIYAFHGDAEFPRLLTQSVISTVKDVPLILIFAFFVALLLRQKFKGDIVVKSIFFLTVILSSDMFLRMQVDTSSINAANMDTSMDASGGVFMALEAFKLDRFYLALGVSPMWINYINDAISNIFFIMIRSGIQIFIFLAGLHSIPASFYEASSIEGATPWETFWKITFPMMGPIMVVNLVYTVIDSFGSYLNETLRFIYDVGFSKFDFGYSSALAIIYFITIGGMLAIVFLIVRKRVFYQSM